MSRLLCPNAFRFENWLTQLNFGGKFLYLVFLIIESPAFNLITVYKVNPLKEFPGYSSDNGSN